MVAEANPVQERRSLGVEEVAPKRLYPEGVAVGAALVRSEDGLLLLVAEALVDEAAPHDRVVGELGPGDSLGIGVMALLGDRVRMSELSMMARDGTKTDADRALYNFEFVQLASYDAWLPAQPPCDLLLTDPPYSTDVPDIGSFECGD